MKMADTRLLVVFILLQVMMCFSIHEVSAATCHASGFVHGKEPKCPKEGSPDCCAAGKRYPQFRCSPPVSTKTPAILTFRRSSDNGEDDPEISLCDGRFHSDRELVVSLSSGWLRLDGKERCNKKIRLSANGRSVLAKVVDECDSVHGCDAEHGFVGPPCRNNVVSASRAIWSALELDEGSGEFKVTWSDV